VGPRGPPFPTPGEKEGEGPQKSPPARKLPTAFTFFPKLAPLGGTQNSGPSQKKSPINPRALWAKPPGVNPFGAPRFFKPTRPGAAPKFAPPGEKVGEKKGPHAGAQREPQRRAPPNLPRQLNAPKRGAPLAKGRPFPKRRAWEETPSPLCPQQLEGGTPNPPWGPQAKGGTHPSPPLGTPKNPWGPKEESPKNPLAGLWEPQGNPPPEPQVKWPQIPRWKKFPPDPLWNR